MCAVICIVISQLYYFSMHFFQGLYLYVLGGLWETNACAVFGHSIVSVKCYWFAFLSVLCSVVIELTCQMISDSFLGCLVFTIVEEHFYDMFYRLRIHLNVAEKLSCTVPKRRNITSSFLEWTLYHVIELDLVVWLVAVFGEDWCRTV